MVETLHSTRVIMDISPSNEITFWSVMDHMVTLNGNGAIETGRHVQRKMSLEELQQLMPDEVALLAQVETLTTERDTAVTAKAALEEQLSSIEATHAAAVGGRDATIQALQAQLSELLAPAAVPDISDRQFFQQLAVAGMITEEEAEDAVAPGLVPAALMFLVQQLPPEKQHPARMVLKGATIFKRSHEFTEAIGALYQWSAEQIDQFFRDAAKL